MPGVIVLSALVAATTADILQGTRLQTVPENGIMTFELSSDLATAAAQYTASIQMPNGDTPLNAVLVPASGVIGLLDDRSKMQISLPSGQGAPRVFGDRDRHGGAHFPRHVYTDPATLT